MIIQTIEGIIEIDEIALAKLFVEYAETEQHLGFLESEIKDAILAIGETREIAGVMAKYYKAGTETPDYEAAAIDFLGNNYPDANLSEYKTTTVTTRWKDVCEQFRIPVPPGESKTARVVVK